MSFQIGHASPNRGKTTTVDPIKSIDDLSKVKLLVAKDVRLHCLFALALNTALRASDLVSLTWDDVSSDGTLVVRERKTSKRRVVPLNDATFKALQAWQDKCCFDHIFSGQRGALTVGSWARIVKDYCDQAGLEGRFASHSMRKSWVRIQLDEFGTSLQTLMIALNHSSERQTLVYCGRSQADVAKAYANCL